MITVLKFIVMAIATMVETIFVMDQRLLERSNEPRLQPIRVKPPNLRESEQEI